MFNLLVKTENQEDKLIIERLGMKWNFVERRNGRFEKESGMKYIMPKCAKCSKRYRVYIDTDCTILEIRYKDGHREHDISVNELFCPKCRVNRKEKKVDEK